MKKRLLILALALVLCLSLAIPCLAAENSLLHDNADLLDPSQEAALSEELECVREAWQVDIVVVTTVSLDGKSPQTYADDFFDYGGYSEDGILMLVSMAERDWAFSTSGGCVSVFGDLSDMENAVIDQLRSNDFYGAFLAYAQACNEALWNANRFPWLRNILICLAIGLVIALIATGVMRSQLKSVRPKHTARDYVRSGSLQITGAFDLYLYSHVSRRAKPKQNSGTHIGSSGRSHGSRSGKF